MSYQVLARKWRPQAFEDVLGQSHVTTPLCNAVTSGRVPHAILLTGPRGVGKTTLARLLARSLNCDQGPTIHPCGECVPCREISGGTSTDVQEIDAASRTGVDDIREVIESIRYAPAPGKYRIFVVDEVHMLSKPAFNALLKTLEEPPPQSLFIFATTNPENIPFTVLSRCQRYDLRRIAAGEVAAHLARIAEAEGVKISESSLIALAREGDGSMRDSQTLLDQVIAHGGNEITDELVSSVLDLVDRRVLLSILAACIDGDPAAALQACALAARSGTEPMRLATAIVEALRDLVVLRVAPDAPELLEGSNEDIAELRTLAARTEAARVRRMFRALIRELDDVARAPQPFAVLEMALVRLASMPSGDEVGQLLSRLEQLEKQLAQSGPEPGPGGSGSVAPGARRAPGAERAAPASRPAPRRSAPAKPASSARERSPAPDEQAAPEASRAQPPAAGPPAATGPIGGDTEAAVVMDRLRAFGAKHSQSLFASLDRAVLLERGDRHLKIGVVGAFHCQRLQDRVQDVEAVCSELFSREVRVEIVQHRETGNEPAPTRRSEQLAPSRELERQRRQEALNHPSVNTALDVLGAEIVEIRPMNGQGRS